MFDWIEVCVVNMKAQVVIIPDQMFPEAPLPNATLSLPASAG